MTPNSSTVQKAQPDLSRVLESMQLHLAQLPDPDQRYIPHQTGGHISFRELVREVAWRSTMGREFATLFTEIGVPQTSPSVEPTAQLDRASVPSWNQVEPKFSDDLTLPLQVDDVGRGLLTAAARMDRWSNEEWVLAERDGKEYALPLFAASSRYLSSALASIERQEDQAAGLYGAAASAACEVARRLYPSDDSLQNFRYLRFAIDSLLTGDGPGAVDRADVFTRFVRLYKREMNGRNSEQFIDPVQPYDTPGLSIPELSERLLETAGNLERSAGEELLSEYELQRSFRLLAAATKSLQFSLTARLAHRSADAAGHVADAAVYYGLSEEQRGAGEYVRYILGEHLGYAINELLLGHVELARVHAEIYIEHAADRKGDVSRLPKRNV